MKFTGASYTKRSKKGLGDFEHEELTMEIILDEEDDAKSCTLALKAMVNSCISEDASDDVVAKAEKAVKEIAKEEPAPKADTPASNAKASKAKTKASKATTKTASKVKTEVSDQEVKDNFKGKGEKATIKYDRDIAEHKLTLSTILDAEYPNWKKDLKAQASKLSKETLPGQPFKDGKGVILDSFKALITEAMGGSEEDAL